MKQYHTNKILGFVLVILFSFSCSSNLDFNQINDFKSEPVYIANLTYFDILAKQFIENGTEKNITFDAQNLMFFGFFF
jgi:ABC-type oligopeptide transport system substrate-binding subunit